MRILIVAPFCSLPGEPYANRFLHLASLLSESHEVCLVTSTFRHFDKSFRAPVIQRDLPFTVQLIPEPGYTANVSFQRARSHLTFERRFACWFDEQQHHTRFDVVYSAYPLIGTNIFLGKRKHSFGYRLIIDVQDIWPESISAALPVLGLLPNQLLPFTPAANKAYGAADALVAVSRDYLKRALDANPHVPGKVVYIGADGSRIKSTAPAVLGESGTHFAYLGTLSHSYDMATVVAAFCRLAKHRLFLHVLGDGPELEVLKRSAGANIRFYGFVDYDRMISIAKACDVLVNAVTRTARASITNKLSDYFLLRKPILNSQTHPEVVDLLARTSCVNYRSGDVTDCVDAVLRIARDRHLSECHDYSNEFDRRTTYAELAEFIEAVQRL